MSLAAASPRLHQGELSILREDRERTSVRRNIHGIGWVGRAAGHHRKMRAGLRFENVNVALDARCNQSTAVGREGECLRGSAARRRGTKQAPAHFVVKLDLSILAGDGNGVFARQSAEVGGYTG